MQPHAPENSHLNGPLLSKSQLAKENNVNQQILALKTRLEVA